MGEIFDALVRLAESLEAFVSPHANAAAYPDGDGWLQRDGADLTIHVFVRSGRVDTIDDVHDSIILAHEIGHVRRVRDGLESAEYLKIVDIPKSEWPKRPREEREAVMVEERAAWEHAREDLRRFGFTDEATFEARRAAALATYAAGVQLA